MELKSGNLSNSEIRINSSNRTFMELKFCGHIAYSSAFAVLIVPLWN